MASKGSFTIQLTQIGNRTQTIMCEKDCNVTISGSLNSANYQPAKLTLGNVITLSSTGNYDAKTLSGTYSLPAGSTISLITIQNTSGGDSNIYDGDGKLRSSYANVTITIDY